MEYVYGALLLHKTGQEISEANLKKVIEATGKEADEAKVKVLVASLKGLDIAKELESASLMAAAPAAEAKQEKEEKKEEKASEAAEGLSALFG
ncbi:50S ribosomal protein P1 [Candidatus Pacearchaeota archaeon]|nr:50S ribosomal protein P1 [Candidatus Pacearchaeota archaeon]